MRCRSAYHASRTPSRKQKTPHLLGWRGAIRADRQEVRNPIYHIAAHFTTEAQYVNSTEVIRANLLGLPAAAAAEFAASCCLTNSHRLRDRRRELRRRAGHELVIRHDARLIRMYGYKTGFPRKNTQSEHNEALPYLGVG